MLNGGLRYSKFKHVYCDAPKAENTWTNLRFSTTPGEGTLVKANSKYFAVALAGGGGPLAVINSDKPCKFGVNVPVLAGHSAAVLDFCFNPFDEHQIATGSEDASVKVWKIPEGGLTETVS